MCLKISVKNCAVSEKSTQTGIDDERDVDKIARTAFVHPSERAAAQILDFYRIRWEYEPTSFPLEWDAEGKVKASFTPDFYLPDYDLYIELTTMNQNLVTKKNRKVRRLKELYPEVSIKIFYQKDFRKLLFRFGIPSASLDHAEGGGFEAKYTASGGER